MDLDDGKAKHRQIYESFSQLYVHIYIYMYIIIVYNIIN